MSNPTPPDRFSQIREWFTFIIAVVAAVSGIIFWVQNASDNKISGLEKDIIEVKSDIKKIQQDNKEIIRIMGRLEGLIDK